MDINFSVILAGIISPFLSELVMKYVGNPEGKKAAWIFFGVSFVLAIVSVIGQGNFNVDLNNPLSAVGVLMSTLAEIIALATIIFHTFKPQIKATVSVL